MSASDPGLIPDPPQMDNPVAYWIWVKKSCEALLYCVPSGQEPDYYSASHPDHAWKDQLEREAAEEAFVRQTEDCLELFLKSTRWPRSKATVAFFVRERLEFAKRFATALATAAQGPNMDGVLPHPKASLGEIIRWLSIDVYNAGHFSEARWSHRCREWH